MDLLFLFMTSHSLPIAVTSILASPELARVAISARYCKREGLLRLLEKYTK